MKRSELVSFLGVGVVVVAAMGTVGCQRVVTVPGGDPQTSGGLYQNDNPPSENPPEEPPPPPLATNIAERKGDKVEITLANYGLQCGADNFTTCGSNEVWEINISLPAVDLVPGAVVPLQGIAMDSGQLALMPGSSPDSCGGGGGTFWDGNVTIDSVTASTITLHLSGTTTLFPTSGTADGSYEVSICGAPPPPPPTVFSTDALAVGPANGPLEIDISNILATCADPHHSGLTCPAASTVDLRITLPEADLAVGTYSMNGLGWVQAWAPENGPCAGGGGTYGEGTINVMSIDANTITFALVGTGEIFGGSGSLGTADAVYVAHRCH